jgi:flagellar basal-body rod protein FlgF
MAAAVWENGLHAGRRLWLGRAGPPRDEGSWLVDNTYLIGMSRQVALERQLDMVANNIANMNTTGFKASSLVFEEFMTSQARENDFAPADAQVHFVVDSTAYRNLSQGPVQQTGNPLDVAINGDAFLSVQTTAGERFTRAGALLINANGQLVTAEGNVVNGDGGPIVFQATDRNISISGDGRISVLEGLNNVETLRGKLKLVSFAQPQRLQHEGGKLFSAPAGVVGLAAPPAVSVIQGAIEGSNVNAVREMSRMIEINRTYSMIASLLKTQSDPKTLDRLAAMPS